MKDMAEKTDNLLQKRKVYYDLGILYRDKAEYEKALEYLQSALKISRDSGSNHYEIMCLQMIAQLYAKDDVKEYDKAIQYAKESLALSGEIFNSLLRSLSWNTLASAYCRQGDFKESIAAARKALEYDSTHVRNRIMLYSYLTESYIGIGNKDSATLSFHEYCDLRDEYVTKELQESIADMEVKYKTEKKVTLIAVLEEERKLYIGLGIAMLIALLSMIGLLVYRHRISIQKRQLAEQQIRQLEQDKELIAVRSALDAEKAEREIIARDLHDGVGAMLSVVKNNMDIMKSYSIIENKDTDYFTKALDGLDKSIVELRRVAHHIMPAILLEKGLFTALNDFCHTIPEVEFHYTESECRFEAEKELILYRCAYELVNNSLRHAEATHIDVHLSMDEKTAYLSVVDNGSGFDIQTISMGMGINNMRTRLAVFCGSLEIYSEPGKGTEVNIELGI